MFVVLLQCQQNASRSKTDSSLRTKKVARSQVRQLERVGHNHHFVFSQKGGGLLMLQRFNKNCWWAVTAFPFKILDNVSSSGSGAEITASGHREVLLGELKFQTCKNIFNTFF
jgi:hypothetical protein